MRILGVDDDRVSRTVLRATVTSLGHECSLAAGGLEAWEMLQHGGFHAVITDRMMPDLDGLELCRRIRSERHNGYVYVILASGLAERDQVREGMLAGADDYLAKPLQRHEIDLRLIAAERVTALHRRLEVVTAELRALSRRDPLTGLGNRLAMKEELGTLGRRAERYGHEYSVALLDLDQFKGLNDSHGHQAGDQALQLVARLLAESCRRGDTCYRYGGEEFLCVFPEQSVAGAGVAVARIQQKLEGQAIPNLASAHHGVLTLSAGVAQLTSRGPDTEDLLRRADQALYRAKAGGRNRIELDAPAVPVPRRSKPASSPGDSRLGDRRRTLGDRAGQDRRRQQVQVAAMGGDPAVPQVEDADRR